MVNKNDAMASIFPVITTVGILTNMILFIVMNSQFKKRKIEVVERGTGESVGTKSEYSTEDEDIVRKTTTGVVIVSIILIAIAVWTGFKVSHDFKLDERVITPIIAGLSGLYGLIVSLQYIANPSSFTLNQMTDPKGPAMIIFSYFMLIGGIANVAIVLMGDDRPTFNDIRGKFRSQPQYQPVPQYQPAPQYQQLPQPQQAISQYNNLRNQQVLAPGQPQYM